MHILVYFICPYVYFGWGILLSIPFICKHLYVNNMQFKNSACQKKNNIYEYNSECFGNLVQIITTPLSLRTGYSFSQETLLWGLLALEVVDTFGPR